MGRHHKKKHAAAAANSGGHRRRDGDDDDRGRRGHHDQGRRGQDRSRSRSRSRRNNDHDRGRRGRRGQDRSRSPDRSRHDHHRSRSRDRDRLEESLQLRLLQLQIQRDESRERRRREESRERRRREEDEGRRRRREDEARRREDEERRRREDENRGRRRPETATLNAQDRYVQVSSAVLNRATLDMAVSGMSRAESNATNFVKQIGAVTVAQGVCAGPNSAGHQHLRQVLDKAVDRSAMDSRLAMILANVGPAFPSLQGSRARARGPRQRSRALANPDEPSTPAAPPTAHDFNAPARPPAGPEPGNTCAACKIDGHSVRRCIATSADGDIESCPFCETFGEHLPEDCPRRAEFDDAALWELFVLDRAGKSQVRTRDSALMWPNLVAREPLPGQTQTRMYPLSRPFAAERYLEWPERYRFHNYRREPEGLVADPRTADPEVVRWDTDLIQSYYPDSGRVLGEEDPDFDMTGVQVADDGQPDFDMTGVQVADEGQSGLSAVLDNIVNEGPADTDLDIGDADD